MSIIAYNARFFNSDGFLMCMALLGNRIKGVFLQGYDELRIKGNAYWRSGEI